LSWKPRGRPMVGTTLNSSRTAPRPCSVHPGFAGRMAAFGPSTGPPSAWPTKTAPPPDCLGSARTSPIRNLLNEPATRPFTDSRRWRPASKERTFYLKEEIGAEASVQTIVGQSPAMRHVVHQIQLVAKTKATVLIEGERRVGKELMARAIHELSDRSSGPFIGLNWAALGCARTHGMEDSRSGRSCRNPRHAPEYSSVSHGEDRS
jgi:hypothetical protein